MKKLYLLIAFCLPVLLFSACGPTSEQALNYNDAVVDEQKLIMDKFNAFFEALSNPADITGIDNSYAATKDQVKLGTDNVSKMDPFDGKTTLRDAAIELFKVYESVLNNELKLVADNYKLPAEKYDEATKTATDAAYDQALQKMDQALTKLETEQKAFAKEYQFEIK